MRCNIDMGISNLPAEIQNNIFFYYAEHPCAVMLKNFILCEECGRVKQEHHKCKYCKQRFCCFCDDYEKVLYRSKHKDDELVCSDCLSDDGLFHHFRNARLSFIVVSCTRCWRVLNLCFPNSMMRLSI